MLTLFCFVLSMPLASLYRMSIVGGLCASSIYMCTGISYFEGDLTSSITLLSQCLCSIPKKKHTQFCVYSMFNCFAELFLFSLAFCFLSLNRTHTHTDSHHSKQIQRLLIRWHLGLRMCDKIVNLVLTYVDLHVYACTFGDRERARAREIEK